MLAVYRKMSSDLSYFSSTEEGCKMKTHIALVPTKSTVRFYKIGVYIILDQWSSKSISFPVVVVVMRGDRWDYSKDQ